MEYMPQVLLIFLLVFLNGFFVASEFALVAVRKTRIDALARRGNRAAKIVKRSLEHLDTYISATQLGITLASLALGWVGEPTLAGLIEPHLKILPDSFEALSAHSIAVAIAFSFITFLHIVFGELAPKSIALQRAEKTSLFVIAPLILFAKLFKPFIFVLNGAGNIVLKLFGLHAPSGHQLVHSEEEIRMILTQSGQEGAIKPGEVQMVENVFELGDIPVKHIMIPRTDIISFKVSSTLKEALKQIEKYPHSRFPVYEHSIDTVIGFIHVKDIYKLALKSEIEMKLSETSLIRKILSVPETKKADDVLFDMKKTHIHLAVVNDEYGGTSGIVTLEDVIESLVGEIEDEFDQPVNEIRKQKDGAYLIDGLVHIENIQKKFNLQLRGQGYTTIAGLVFGLLGREPRVGDIVQIGNISFEIVKLQGKRIKTMLLRREKKSK